MTTKELNLSWRRLIVRYVEWRDSVSYSDEHDIWDEHEQMRSEFHRLHHADKSFRYCTKQSILIQMYLNRKLDKPIADHRFGLFAEEDLHVNGIEYGTL